MSSQWSTGSMSPPAGESVNLVDPPGQLPANIAVHAICLTASTLAVLLRVYTRVRINRATLGVDDYLAFASYLINILWSGVFFESMRWGVGRHLWNEPQAWLVYALKWQTIASWVYIVSETVVKLSFLFLYRRIFSVGKQRTWATWVIELGIAVCLLFNLGMFFGVVFFCVPVQKGWNAALPGHCSDPETLAYLTGAWNCVVDLFILILPMPLIRGLNMGQHQRARLVLVFSIGLFACVASVVRLGMTFVLQSNDDVTYNMARVGLWATIEINVGLTCSCMILLPAFLRHHLPESAKTYLRSINFTRLKSGKSSKGNPHWPGSYKEVIRDPSCEDSGSNAQFSQSRSDKQILKTNSFTMQVLNVPRADDWDVESGDVTMNGSQVSYQRQNLHQSY